MIDAGCDVLLEKPIATTLEDCDAIAARAEAAGRILQIGLVYRYSNLYRRMAEIGSQPGSRARERSNTRARMIPSPGAMRTAGTITRGGRRWSPIRRSA